MSLNIVVLVGRLTKDVELRYTGTGVAIASFTIAVDRNFTNQQGEKETDFVRTVCFKKLAEVCANNLGKGRLVSVNGRLQIRSYDKDGERRQVAEVVAESVQFLDWPKDGARSGNEAVGGGTGHDYQDDDDSDLPF